MQGRQSSGCGASLRRQRRARCTFSAALAASRRLRYAQAHKLARDVINAPKCTMSSFQCLAIHYSSCPLKVYLNALLTTTTICQIEQRKQQQREQQQHGEEQRRLRAQGKLPAKRPRAPKQPRALKPRAAAAAKTPSTGKQHSNWAPEGRVS